VPVFVMAAIGYGTTPVDGSGLRVDFAAATVGVGVSYDRVRALALDVSLGARLERVGAYVSEAAGSDAASTVIAGGALGGDIGFRPSRIFAFVIGADGFLRAQGATVQVRGAPVGRALPIGGDVHVGVRVFL
jgi:hypothetical protein